MIIQLKIQQLWIATVCFSNLDQGSEMISFETTLIASLIFRVSCGSSKN
jgi:hypothetical protein